MAQTKERQKEYQKIYYQNHKEQSAAYKKIYTQKNKQRILERDRKYYQENKERIKERNKSINIENEENKKQLKEYYKKWRQNNKHKIRIYNKRNVHKSLIKSKENCKDLHLNYIKKLLKTKGVPKEIIESQPELIQLQTLILKTKRYGKQHNECK